MAKELNNDVLQANLRALDRQAQMMIEQSPVDEENRQRIERVKQVADRAFMERFAACRTVEDVQALFARNGVDFSRQEVTEILSTISRIDNRLTSDDAALSEEELEAVSGGGWLGVLVGTAVGAVAVASFLTGQWYLTGVCFAAAETSVASVLLGAMGGCVLGEVTENIVRAVVD